MNTKTQLTTQQIVDGLPIGKLTNTNDNPFWYLRQGRDKFFVRYCHEKADVGDIFYDGNNGDRWRVVAVGRGYKRLLVENTTQGGVRFIYWD